jgi:V/A-type H+-transporting ATPase subunit I
MAISPLSKVTMIVAKSELEQLVGKLYKFGEFHPSDESPFYEEFSLLQLRSKAFELFSNLDKMIKELEEKSHFEQQPEFLPKISFIATDFTDFLQKITMEIDRISSKLSLARQLDDQDLRSIFAYREAALIIFEVLRRIRVKYETKYFAIIEGFIPSKRQDEFRDKFSKWYHVITQIRKNERNLPYVPTLLTNPSFIKLFEDITIEQGVPRYQEIDPTPFIAFIFPMFYGIMFSDIGQGIVLLLFGKFISFKQKRNYRYWGKMMMAFGVSATIAGIVTGNFFGLELSDFTFLPSIKIFEGGVIKISAVMTIIIFAILVGTFHLALAYIIVMINKIRMGELVDAFTYEFATLVMYSFSILFTLSLMGVGNDYLHIFTNTYPVPFFSQFLAVTIPTSSAAVISSILIISSILSIIFGRALASLRAGEFSAMLSIGVSDAIFKPIEFLTNTISYSRLGIFLIMHSALMGLVNGAWLYGFSGLPLIILGNIFVMALEGFLVYIQDLRLHLYEWFGKFGEAGDAILFRPLSVETQYVNIKFSGSSSTYS